MLTLSWLENSEINMKKYGFTLAEVLVAMSIIAISAAILAPMVIQIKPDRYKLKVLQAYQLANDATERLLEDQTIYFRDLSGTFANCIGLDCAQQPTATPYNNSNYTGGCKYPNLMVSILNLDNVTQCTSSNWKATGTGSNGVYWEFIYEHQRGRNEIMIDVDPSSRGINHTYDSQHKTPDRFTFIVDTYGDIKPNDDLSKIYIRNMANINKNDDFAELSN